MTKLFIARSILIITALSSILFVGVLLYFWWLPLFLFLKYLLLIAVFTLIVIGVPLLVVWAVDVLDDHKTKNWRCD